MAGTSRLFGTDGVRGRANVDLTADLAFALACAAGENSDGPVLIGRDTRRSGPMLVSALAAGFNTVGVDTVDVGIIPVGAVSRLARDTRSRYGIMVSASHNPAPDNGIKFFGPDGAKLSDAREDKIAVRFHRGEPWKRPTGGLIGMQSAMSDALDRYVQPLVESSSYSMRGMSFVLDCANGAAFDAAPALFRRLGADVEIHNAEPNGININEGCGATHPGYLATRAKGRVGFAFDGDADRCIAIDEDGEPVDGDVIMAILASHLLERGRLKRNMVVTTVMANFGFRKAMRDLDVEVVETRVGDRYVLEAMRESRAVLGGEQSGHVILEDRATGDGLRTALRIAEVLAATGQPLRELRKVMTAYPQVLRNVAVENKDALDHAGPVWEAVRRAEDLLGDDGRILVRASGTEPLVRVMAEARTKSAAEDAVTLLISVVERELR